jgi:hypothetical protein
MIKPINIALAYAGVFWASSAVILSIFEKPIVLFLLKQAVIKAPWPEGKPYT